MRSFSPSLVLRTVCAYTCFNEGKLRLRYVESPAQQPGRASPEPEIVPHVHTSASWGLKSPAPRFHSGAPTVPFLPERWARAEFPSPSVAVEPVVSQVPCPLSFGPPCECHLSRPYSASQALVSGPRGARVRVTPSCPAVGHSHVHVPASSDVTLTMFPQ